MRLKKSLQNVSAGIFRQMLGICLNFVNRTIFIYTLGYEYLGVNGLFGDILSMLSVAELGIGTAIAYSMYKPMAEGDETKLYALAQIYKKTYILIGSIVAMVGVGLTPVLEFFIKDASGVRQLEAIYLLVLANSVVSYFYSYKITLLTVAQKAYKESLVRSFVNVIQVVGQIVYLLLTKDYIGYLVLQLLGTLTVNVIVSRMAEREFPFIRENRSASLEQEEKGTLIKNVRALVLHKMGNFFVNGTDNILISKLVGLVINGIYANYLLIIRSIRGVTYLIFSALTSSVGNLNALEEKDVVLDRFYKVYFMGYWLTTFCAASLLCLLNPFIHTMWGETLDMIVVVIIVLNFYLSEMRNPVMIFKDAMGLYWQDRYKPLFESLVNIVASIILGKYLGILGVLIGTAISAAGVVCWLEPLVLYRHGFLRSSREYFLRYLRDGAVAIGIILLTWGISNAMSVEGWVGIVCTAVICLIVPNTALVLIYHRTKEYRYFVQIAVSGVNHLCKRQKTL